MIDQIMSGEKIICQSKIHPVIVAPAIPLVLMGMYMVEMSATPGMEQYPNAVLALRAIALSTVFFLVARWMCYSTSFFTISDRRVTVQSGWIKRERSELPINKIESVSIFQSIMGRLFDYGNIVVCGTGGTKQVFPKINHPALISITINEQISNRANKI